MTSGWTILQESRSWRGRESSEEIRKAGGRLCERQKQMSLSISSNAFGH